MKTRIAIAVTNKTIDISKDDFAGQKASAHAICNCWTLLVECACQPLDDATAPPPPVYCERLKGGMGFISIRVCLLSASLFNLIGEMTF